MGCKWKKKWLLLKQFQERINDQINVPDVIDHLVFEVYYDVHHDQHLSWQDVICTLPSSLQPNLKSFQCPNNHK